MLDSLDPLVGALDGVAAKSNKLPHVFFGLFLLAHQGSDPNGWVCQFYCLFLRGCPVGDLE